MDPETVSGRITAEWRINDVLSRYPGTAPIFSQGRRMFVEAPRELYPRFPGLTLAEYAQQNGLDLEGVLRHLNAEAESEEAARRLSAARPGEEQSRLSRQSPTLGYTSSFRPGEDEGPGHVPVTVHSAGGPE